MRVFITGGSGQIGSAIAKALVDRGDEVVVLTRDVERAQKVLADAVELVEGDPCYDAKQWQPKLSGCDAVISLAGEPVSGQRWNARFRQKLHDSRIDSTRFLAEGVLLLDEAQRPNIFVATSSIHYYGFAEFEMFDDDEFDENATGGESFLSYLCWDWEDETKACLEAGVRVATMRIGTILGRDSEAYQRIAPPFKFGLAGKIGKGTQWTSWIHIDDVVGAYLHALDSDFSGPANLVAPGNVRNYEMAAIAGRVLGKSPSFPAPALLVRAKLGPYSEYILKGRQAIPKALSDSGYEFKYSELKPALRDLSSGD